MIVKLLPASKKSSIIKIRLGSKVGLEGTFVRRLVSFWDRFVDQILLELVLNVLESGVIDVISVTNVVDFLFELIVLLLELEDFGVDDFGELVVDLEDFSSHFFFRDIIAFGEGIDVFFEGFAFLIKLVEFVEYLLVVLVTEAEELMVVFEMFEF